MKQLLIFLFSAFTVSTVHGQCDPLTDFGDVQFGVNPDTVENFAIGMIGEPYSQQIDIKTPENAGFADPLFSFLTIDSVVLASISGLPEGFQFECNNTLFTPCAYAGGEEGCAVLFGIPQDTGTFELEVGFLVYTSVQTIPFSVEGYRIVIEDKSLSTDEPQKYAFQLKPSSPNPAVQYTRLAITAPRSERATLAVYDLAGRNVREEQRMLHTGENTWRLETVKLENGIYVYRIDAFGESRSGRFVVSR